MSTTLAKKRSRALRKARYQGRLLKRRARANWQVPWRRRLLYLMIPILVFFLVVPPVWQLKSGPISIVRWPKSGQRVIDIGPQMSNWTPIKRVSRHVLNAFVVAEDGRFYEHSGIDWEQVHKSVEVNLVKRRYARGGSTITQQVVKMAFLSNEKTLRRKISEALGAVLLEQLLTKDEILAWYINMAEFGDGVFGIKEAAWHYFRTKPETLTVQHGAHLALVLPSPNAWSKGLRQKRLTSFGQHRYAAIIQQLRAGGYITDALRDVAMATGDFGQPIRGWQSGSDDHEGNDKKKSSSSDAVDEDEDENHTDEQSIGTNEEPTLLVPSPSHSIEPLPE